MTSQFQLVMHAGPTPGKVFPLTEGELTIGRDINNQIIINDAEISRRHTRLVLQGDAYMIEDLGSTNGTFVSGQRLSGPRLLRPSDTIRLGENVTLSYEVAGYDPDATAVAGPGYAAVPPTNIESPRPAPGRQQAPARPVQPQPRMQQAPPPPAYAGQVPPGPPQEETGWVQQNKGLLIGCGVVLVIAVCALAGFLYWVDSTYRWCQFFGWIIPGCP
jgi:hypothetical protein